MARPYPSNLKKTEQILPPTEKPSLSASALLGLTCGNQQEKWHLAKGLLPCLALCDIIKTSCWSNIESTGGLKVEVHLLCAHEYKASHCLILTTNTTLCLRVCVHSVLPFYFTMHVSKILGRQLTIKKKINLTIKKGHWCNKILLFRVESEQGLLLRDGKIQV